MTNDPEASTKGTGLRLPGQGRQGVDGSWGWRRYLASSPASIGKDWSFLAKAKRFWCLSSGETCNICRKRLSTYSLVSLSQPVKACPRCCFGFLWYTASRHRPG